MFFTKINLQPNAYYLGALSFAPVVEPASPDAFLSESVEELCKKGALHDVPYVVGINTLEGLIMCKYRPTSGNVTIKGLCRVHLRWLRYHLLDYKNTGC